jgi:hypothetical protein
MTNESISGASGATSADSIDFQARCPKYRVDLDGGAGHGPKEVLGSEVVG